MANITSASLEVSCVEGFDGGLAQLFVLQVFQVKTEKLVANLTSTLAPQFSVHSLEAGIPYELHLWARNAKGQSATVVLMTET